MKMFLKSIKNMILSGILIIIALDTSILTHEWIHGFVAWLAGIKSTPFDIYYGDWTLLNVDESVDYPSLLQAGKNGWAAAIAITPVLINAFLTLVSFYLLYNKDFQKYKKCYFFLFWFCAFNLQEFFSYIPIRTFTTHADIANFTSALEFSPFVVGIPGTIFSAVMIGLFFRNLLTQVYLVLNKETGWQKLPYLLGSLFVIFFMGGCRGLDHYGSTSAIMGEISLAFIPIILFLYVPFKSTDKNPS